MKKKMKRTIAQQSRQNLCIYRKILIAKPLLIWQFINIIQSIGLADIMLHSINRALYAFLWEKKKKQKYNNNKKIKINNTKNEQVKRKVLEQEIEKDGQLASQWVL